MSQLMDRAFDAAARPTRKELEAENARLKTALAWSLAKKTSIGNVYHAVRAGVTALCSKRIKLEDGRFEQQPTDGYVCKRCFAIVNMNNALRNQ